MYKYSYSYGYTPTNYPDVLPTINKNRLKVYSDNTIFLNHGDEFELEFDNRTEHTWLAKIKLNGEFISNSGIVLRPGERIYLDTPDLDSRDKRRFRFDVYTVEKGRKQYTRNNGDVEVFFYMKSVSFPTRIDWYKWSSNETNYRGDNYQYDNLTSGGCHVSNFYNSDKDGNAIYAHATNLSSRQVEETGRIEAGSQSGQNFHNVNESFESYHSYSVKYKLLPHSQKPKTINEVKRYCTSCGKKQKKGYRFCPVCGTKF